MLPIWRLKPWGGKCDIIGTATSNSLDAQHGATDHVTVLQLQSNFSALLSDVASKIGGA